ncbi:unnamed protein product [Allacma fusca]|uniref:Integrase catalytic domain-containing protein n=1 Tax=Allacma fusca TaxID=39272 RepID=A0A8J2LCB2_9HEXA|nr:unnamed protein product [Allacma fusca]
MDELIAKRKTLRGRLTRLKNKADDPVAQQWDIDTVNLYEKHVDDLRAEIHCLYEDILASCPTEEEEHQRQCDEYVDRCDEVELTIKRILRGLLGGRPLNQNRRLSRNQAVPNEVSTKLPKLDIPKFSDDRAAILNSSECGKPKPQQSQPKQGSTIDAKRVSKNITRCFTWNNQPPPQQSQRLSANTASFNKSSTTTQLSRYLQDVPAANRVAIIQESLPYESWHHVSGIENPADCASRGLKPADLLQHDLWCYGPQWLKDVDAKFITTDATNLSMYKTDLEQEHVNQLHGGTQLVLATIQRRFWIVNGRDAVRRQIRRCVLCSRFRAESASQMMSDLPSVRVNPQRPFSKAGIDYTGPFLLRKSRGKGNKNYKGYISLFICMVTRAVHLEVVSSLSSQDFISALKTFIARRGQPSDLYSDCGRNFVGADKELKQQWKSVSFTNEIGTFMGMKQIKWHFNPPASPHFGGLREAGMKSLKHHLTRAMGSCVFTYEDMQTIVCQIEACLNSRPLTQLTSDPNDYSTLTPGHFLIGDAMTALPEQNHSCEPESVLTRWKMMQRVVQHFWKRWSCEYLSKLQQRPKWLSTRPTLQTGDLVLVKVKRFPPLKWKMARIVEAHPGADGLSRVFTIRTADGIFKRPLIKLCPLPIDPTS